MTLTTIAFFNNKGGGGKMSLVYHVAWMFSELGVRVIAADLACSAAICGCMTLRTCSRRRGQSAWMTSRPTRSEKRSGASGITTKSEATSAAHSGRQPIAQRRYLDRIPGVYREAVLKRPPNEQPPAEDPNRLGIVKHYHSLIQLAQEARAPMFLLKPADGAIGAYSKNVIHAAETFEALARRIAAGAHFALEGPG